MTPVSLPNNSMIGSRAMIFVSGRLARDGPRRLVTLPDGSQLPVPGLALGD